MAVKIEPERRERLMFLRNEMEELEKEHPAFADRLYRLTEKIPDDRGCSTKRTAFLFLGMLIGSLPCVFAFIFYSTLNLPLNIVIDVGMVFAAVSFTLGGVCFCITPYRNTPKTMNDLAVHESARADAAWSNWTFAQLEIVGKMLQIKKEQDGILNRESNETLYLHHLGDLAKQYLSTKEVFFK